MRVEKQIEYDAASDVEAIAIAKERLGRDAVILESRRIKVGGLFGVFKREVLRVQAGILVPDREDVQRESRDRMMAFQHLLEVRRAVGGDAVAMLPEPAYGTSAFASEMPHQAPVLTYAASQAAQTYKESQKLHKEQEPTDLAKDVVEIRSLLHNVLERLNYEGQQESVEERDPNVSRLIEADVDRSIAASLVREFREEKSASPLQEWLAGKIPTLGPDSTSALGGKRVLFAGPTGVGKTTTIAKIAATQSLWEDKRVVLITADTYRIAAVEQLRTFAKILGIPLEIAAEPGDISNFILKKHKDADLILLDTAGRSHYDGARMDELKHLYDAFMPDSVHLVMAANIKYRDMLDVIDRMGVVPLSALIFTKLDETSTYGTIVNILRDFNLPLSFITMGQNVPNDIEVGRGDRLVEFLFENRVNGKG